MCSHKFSQFGVGFQMVCDSFLTPIHRWVRALAFSSSFCFFRFLSFSLGFCIWLTFLLSRYFFSSFLIVRSFAVVTSRSNVRVMRSVFRIDFCTRTSKQQWKRRVAGKISPTANLAVYDDDDDDVDCVGDGGGGNIYENKENSRRLTSSISGSFSLSFHSSCYRSNVFACRLSRFIYT